ncbi:hypothetical protein BCR33DRAFT_422648 [Rhizoclosmatium globosum]|uniref:MBD domain-containing protein n=1 Tax=Rhizoclosmatium globosum TaxID=329046 RepID=A0A1Y2BVS7_9FUNG|nr:hypothetical protein BCR33DRAFT_422648 [Rhizoclosmatium globosum]|eukprot:ORY38869.1 hypothetical protein BCR33DRAFT_422648 [Rhizoclosmatium globosum]
MTSKQRATGHLDCTWVAPNGLKFRSYKSVQDYCDKNGIQLSSSNIINNHEVHHDPEIQAVLEESIASSHAVTVSAASNHEDDEEDEEVPLTKPVKQKLSQRKSLSRNQQRLQRQPHRNSPSQL